MMEDFLYIARVVKPHGVNGEIKVFPTTDDISRFKRLKGVYISVDDNIKYYEIKGVKYVSKYVVLKLEGINSMEDAYPLIKGVIQVSRKDAIALEEGEFFHSDLIGLNVTSDQGENLGVLTNIIQTGSNDVYVVQMDSGKELLLPAIKECVLEINVKDNSMKVHVMEGLL